MNPQIIKRYKNANDIGPCYEGIVGLIRFEELLKTIGYTEDGCGERVIIDFLEDNSGAIQALEDWIIEQDIPNWEEELVAETPYDSDIDDIVEEEIYAKNSLI